MKTERFYIFKYSFSKPKSYFIFLFSASIMGYVFWYFTDSRFIIGNLGKTYNNIQIISQFVITFLFSLNITLLINKLELASLDKSNSSLIGISGLFGIVASGCPACGITFASYIGLSSVLSALPYYGLELKIIGILVLLYSTFDLTKSITCKI